MAKSDVLVRMKADTANYDANIAKARRQLDQFKKDNLSVGGVMKQLSSSLVASAASFASVTAAVGVLSRAFSYNIETARNFEKSMSQLSSLTGMVGSDLDKLKEYSIELGASTTLSASQVADAFKLIGSQQPQLLSSGEALKSVTKNAITLAEAAGIELTDAAKTLSVSINQMGGDSSNAERFVNVLAAASQKGAGDIVWLGEAITKSGTTAKAVGTDYEELVANLEQLAKAGYDASTAGTALRSIIMNLEKQANNDYKPSVVGLTQAFQNLGDANLTLTEYQGIAGKMFAAQAKALADAAAEAKNMKEQITGTSTAEEQAATNTANLDGSLKSLASAWEGLNLHLNSSNGLLKTTVDAMTDLVRAADKALGVLSKVNEAATTFLKGGTWDEILKPFSAKEALNKAMQEQATKYVQDLKSRASNLLKFGSGGDDKEKSATGGIAADADNATKSIKELQAEIKKLKALRDDAADTGDTDMVSQYNTQIKSIQAQIKSMRGIESGKTGKKTKVYAEDSIVYQEKLVQELTKKWREAGAAVRDDYAKQLSEAKQTLSEMQGGFSTDKIGQIQDLTGRTPMADLTQGAELTLPVKLEIQSPVEQWKDQIASLQEAMSTAWSTEAITAYQDEIDALQKKIDKFTGKTDGGNMAKDWQSAANAIGQVGSAMQQIEDPAAKVMGIIAQAIATIALTFAKSMEGTFTPWDWIAGAAAGTATMISTISAIKSATAGSYAEGGIIPGNHYSGDQQWAQVNAGELILNRSQQNSIAGQLQDAERSGGYTPSHISGEQIYIALNRYTRRTGKGELVTWRN